MKKRIHKVYHCNNYINNTTTKKELIKYNSMTYVNSITPRLTRIIHEKTGTNICSKNHNTFNSKYFTKLKTKIPLNNKTNVVYSLNCLDCPSTYIGQTKNPVKSRMNNHIRDIKNASRGTAVSKHAIEELHRFEFENVKILSNERNLYKRRFLEMCHIKTDKNSINNQEDIQHLSKIYFNLL